MGLFSGGGFFGGGSLSSGENYFHRNSLGGELSGVIRRDDSEMMREIVKQSDTLAGELLRTVDDAKDELYELCTDGFVEMVIKGNSDYKTSFEIKEEADERIGESRRQYQKKCCEFNKYLDKLNNRINDMYKKKVEIARRLNQTVSNMPNMPKISGFVDSPSYSYKPSTISMLCEYSGIGSVSDIKGRKNSANEYLEDAKDFEVEIFGKIAEISRIEAFLDTIELNLDEEELMLDALNDSLNTRRNMAYDKIATQLHILISEYILDPSGKKNEKYMEAINQLRKIS